MGLYVLKCSICRDKGTSTHTVASVWTYAQHDCPETLLVCLTLVCGSCSVPLVGEGAGQAGTTRAFILIGTGYQNGVDVPISVCFFSCCRRRNLMFVGIHNLYKFLGSENMILR